MSEVKPNCGEVTNRGEEGWIETASRRTEIGYKALSPMASVHLIAKPLWSKGDGVNPAVVQGRNAFLPGETSVCA